MEPYAGGPAGSCHADPMPLKIKDRYVWWCNRYEADPEKIKAEEDAIKAQKAAEKKIAAASKKETDVIAEGVEKLQGEIDE